MLEPVLIGLLLIMVANGAPVLAQRAPRLGRFAYPLDGYWRFTDRRRVLGPGKTWRGVVVAVLATSLAAMILGLPWHLGVVVALLAMLGDALSSFIKRRMDIRPSGMAIGLDQVPESLLPFLYLRAQWDMNWIQPLVGIGLFFLLELFLSRILYRLSIRKRPY